MKKVISWLFFSIFYTIFTILMLFYLDLANGPFYFLLIELGIIILILIIRLLLNKKNFFVRNLVFLMFIALNVPVVIFAHPAITTKRAVNDSNAKQTEVLELRNGKVVGLLNTDETVQVYAGIPYAKAPVGDLRWKEPQEAESWEGVLDCTNFAPRAMQKDRAAVINSAVDIYAEKSWHPDYSSGTLEPMSEDCLYLNIWRPNNDKKDLPIVVYIHGGSLMTGGSSHEDHNGEAFAKNDVIMITISYRLGIFGYLALEELASESPNGTTGNYGLLDQIMALQWVNLNSEYFGGDKNNITIAGESAGSSSVNALCCSPLAKGLFKRAIAESSSITQQTPPHTFRTMEKALAMGKEIMNEFSVSSLSQLRSMSAEELVQTKYENSAMTVDGYALTKMPYETYLAHENNEEVLLNGYNLKEADAFVVPTFLLNPTNKDNIRDRVAAYLNEEVADELMEYYKDRIDNGDAFAVLNEIVSIYWFINPHHNWSNMMCANGQTVYRYQFTKENGYYGTYHSGEIIYAYGNLYRSPRQFAYSEEDYALSNIMSSYWLNFIKTGNPNGEGLPEWKAYDPNENLVLELGENVGMINDEYLEVYSIINKIYQ